MHFSALYIQNVKLNH